jgi:hypothetical protein
MRIKYLHFLEFIDKNQSIIVRKEYNFFFPPSVPYSVFTIMQFLVIFNQNI